MFDRCFNNQINFYKSFLGGGIFSNMELLDASRRMNSFNYLQYIIYRWLQYTIQANCTFYWEFFLKANTLKASGLWHYFLKLFAVWGILEILYPTHVFLVTSRNHQNRNCIEFKRFSNCIFWLSGEMGYPGDSVGISVHSGSCIKDVISPHI